MTVIVKRVMYDPKFIRIITLRYSLLTGIVTIQESTVSKSEKTAFKPFLKPTFTAIPSMTPIIYFFY